MFVTLTYDDAHLFSLSLVYRDFQLFMKRLRFWSRTKVRFFMCGEYGEQNGRPHFHACLFGCFFPDRVLYKELASGSKLYTSAKLEELWPNGFSSIGDVTFESAAYVARYATKSFFSGHDGKRRDCSQGFICSETGEFFPFVPEFNRCSLKPGLGGQFFERYGSEIFGCAGDLDRVVVNGAVMRAPRYYTVLLQRVNEWAAANVRYMRGLEREAAGDVDLSPERLRVREAVARSRLAFKRRGFS